MMQEFMDNGICPECPGGENKAVFRQMVVRCINAFNRIEADPDLPYRGMIPAGTDF